jgi:hypothetical protein
MAFNDILTRLNSVVVDTVTCTAAFVAPYEELALGGVSVSSSSPQIVGATTDFPANPVGKLATVRGQNYRVVESKPDSFGASTLVLELVL